MADDLVRFQVCFRGHVQGVGFRMTAIAQARGLSVHGFVRNEPDGSVLMDVEGTERDVKELILRIEMAMSGNVEETQIQDRPPRGSRGGFQIRH